MKLPLVKSLRVSSGTILLALTAVLPARADYSNTVMSLNPIGYWRLNEPAGSGTAANIGSAGATANAAYIGSPTLQQPGAMGTDPAALFDGASQYASVPYDAAFNPPGSFTVGFWANKTNSDTGTRGAIFSRDRADIGQNGWLFFASNGDGNWWFRTYTDNVRANAISSSPIVLNQWTHVVGVHDATDTGTNYLYVNGVLAAAPVGNAGYTPNGSFPMFFAAWADTTTAAPGFFFPGRLDEIAFFNKALTPAQIHDLYVAAEYPPRIVQQPSAPSKIYAGDPVPITLSVVVENVSATPETYQWTKNDTNIPGATTATLNLGVATTNASGNYAVVISNPNGSVTSTVVPISVVPPPPGRVDYANTVLSLNPVAYYRLNDAANATTTANVGSWGTGANGTYKPGASGGSPGVAYPGFGAGNYGTLFAGTAGLRDGAVGDPDTPGSCLKVPAQSGIVEEMTITCWVRRDGDNMVWRGLVTQRDTDPLGTGHGGNGTGLTLGGEGTSPNRGADLHILWNKDDVYWQWNPGGAGNYMNTPNQQWAFCAVVFSLTNRTVYLNTRAVSREVPLDETTMPATPHDWSVNPIFIGYDARGPYYGENSAFKGSMDEVAIFNRALTTNEMMQIYAAAEVPPIILSQPQAPPPPVFEGMALSLSVLADQLASTTPLAYQWTKNGIPIPGQTTTNYTVSNLVTADSGSYAVVITNNYAAVTSSIVAFTVLAGPPVFAQQPQPAQRLVGGSATFTALAYGSVPLSYQWSFNGTPISGATSAAYTVAQVGTGDVGNYSVRVTNPYGFTNSTAVALSLMPVSGAYAAEVAASGPVSYWQFDETSGTTAADYMGGVNGVNVAMGFGNNGPLPSSSPVPFVGMGNNNKTYTFNGSASEVQLPKSFALNRTAFSIVAWIRADTATAYQCIMAQGGNLWRFHLDSSASTLELVTEGLGGGALLGTIPVVDGFWHQVVAVYDGARKYLYVDGLPDGSAASGGLLSTNSDIVTIGSQGSFRWLGDIDEVAVYNRGLSEAEVVNLYRAATSAPGAPRIVTQPVSQTVFAGELASLSVTVEGGAPYSYQWKQSGTNLPGATKRNLTFPSAFYTDAGTYSVTITGVVAPAINSQPATLTVAVPAELATFANVTNDLVLHLKFDGNYQDSSGRNNNGTPQGAPGPTFVPGKIGSSAVHVDSEADLTDPGTPVCTNANYVTLGMPPDLLFGADTNFTVAYWVKMPPGEDYTEFPVLCDSLNGTFNPGLYFGTDWNSPNGGGFTWWLGGATAGKVYESPANTINDGNWHHLLFSFDRQSLGVTYLDGVAVDSRSISGGGDVDVSGPLNIGQDASGTYPWFGLAGPKAECVIDDMGIWRRALSHVDAQTMYAVAQKYGRTFDVYGPVLLTVQPSGTGFDLIWQAGTLLSSDTVNGTYLPVAGTSPSYYHVTPSAAKKFYRVRL